MSISIATKPLSKRTAKGVSKEEVVVPDTSDIRSELVHTTQSNGFDVKWTHRRRVRNVRRAQMVASSTPIDSRFDEAGRPIVVVNTCDAMRLCRR